MTAVRISRDKEYNTRAKTQVTTISTAVITNSSDQKGYLQPGLGVANVDVRIDGMLAIYSTLTSDGSLLSGYDTTSLGYAAYPDTKSFMKLYDAFTFAVGKPLRSTLVNNTDLDVYNGNATNIGSSKIFSGFNAGNGVAGDVLPQWYVVVKF